MTATVNVAAPGHPMPIVPLLLLAWPFLEIAGFIIVGEAIGVLPTIALTLATSALGAALLRHQGTALLADMQRSIRSDGLSGRQLGHGALMSIGALLLILPGFVGDLVGLMLFVPAFRALAIALLGRNLKVVVVGGKRSGTVDLDPAEWRHSEERDPDHSEPRRLTPPTDPHDSRRN